MAGSSRRPRDELRGAVGGVHDDRVDRVIEPALGPGLAGAGLAREQIVRGEHHRAAREQAAVEPLHVEPLEVHDVGRGGDAAVGEHLGAVHGELGQPAQPASRRGPGTWR